MIIRYCNQVFIKVWFVQIRLKEFSLKGLAKNLKNFQGYDLGVIRNPDTFLSQKNIYCQFCLCNIPPKVPRHTGSNPFVNFVIIDVY